MAGGNRKGMSVLWLKVLFGVIAVVAIAFIASKLGGFSNTALKIGPAPGNDFKVDEQKELLAKEFFNDYTTALENCRENTFNEDCLCAVLPTGSLDTLALLSTTGKDEKGDYVNVSLIATPVKRVSDLTGRNLIEHKKVYVKYGSIAGYGPVSVEPIKEDKNTEISNNNRYKRAEIWYGSNKLEYYNLNNDKFKILLVRHGGKVYNAYPRNDGAFLNLPLCSKYYNIKNKFMEFNKALDYSLKTNKRAVFDGILDENYSFKLIRQDNGLNVTLNKFFPTKRFSWHDSSPAQWKPLMSVFYPKADFRVYEKAYVENPKTHDITNYATSESLCRTVEGIKYCILNNHTISENGITKNLRIKSVMLYYNKTVSGYVMIKRYGYYDNGRLKKFDKNGVFGTWLETFYEDYNDRNIGKQIVFVEDDFYDSGNNVTIEGFNEMEGKLCEGKGYSCVAKSEDCKGEIVSKECDDGKLCCFDRCNLYGGVCTKRCEGTENCVWGCPQKNGEEKELIHALSPDIDDFYKGICPAGEVCCQYEKQ